MERLGAENIRKIDGSSSGEPDEGGITLRRASISIPHDLMTEILARLPAKSLVRFLCVSKLWASTIRDRDFMKSFLAHSSTRPSLLFSFMDLNYDSNLFCSSPYPGNPDDESSCLANHVATFPGYLCNTMFRSVRGLICFGPHPRFMVCNPSTRGSMILPEIESKLKWETGYGFFGHDPVDDQYKVLWVMRPEVFDVNGRKGLDHEIQVFTLGDREWRRIEGIPLHFPCSNGICTNGVVYYKTWNNGNGAFKDILVSFDVRSEKFNFIKIHDYCVNSSLINFKGRLALSYSDEARNKVVVLVLLDAEKEEWLKMVYDLPIPLRDLVRDSDLRFDVCATDAGEIILAPHLLCNPFYLLYYNPRKNSLRKVEIEGITHHDFRYVHGKPAFSRKIWTFPDHVENIMFL